MKKPVAKVTNYQLQTLKMHQIDTLRIKTFDQAQKLIKRLEAEKEKTSKDQSKSPVNNLEGSNWFSRWSEDK